MDPETYHGNPPTDVPVLDSPHIPNSLPYVFSLASISGVGCYNAMPVFTMISRSPR